MSQIPGRLIFAPLAARLPSSVAVAGVLALVAVGIAVLAGSRGNAAVITGLVLLGMGNGMALLARATVIADRYGSATYGALSGVAASVTTAAHGLGPVAGATFAAAAGYPALLWTLAGLTVAAAALAWCSEPAPSA